MLCLFLSCLHCEIFLDLHKLKAKIIDHRISNSKVGQLHCCFPFLTKDVSKHDLLIKLIDLLITTRNIRTYSFDQQFNKLQNIDKGKDKCLLVLLRDKYRIIGSVIFYCKSKKNFAETIVNLEEEMLFDDCDLIFENIECNESESIFRAVNFLLRLPKKIDSDARKFFFK